MEFCSICNGKFNKSKRYQKLSTHATVKHTNSTAGEILSNLGVFISPDKQKSVFLCNVCSASLGKLCVSKERVTSARQNLFQSAKSECYIGKKISRLPPSPISPISPKRRRITSTPKKHVSYKTYKKPGTNNTIPRAAHLISKSKYLTALRLLLKQSKAFKRAFLHVLQDVITREMRYMCCPTNSSIWRSGRNKIEVFENFKWSSAIDEAASLSPTLLAVLTAATTCSKQRRQLQRGKKRKISVIPNIAAIIGQLVFVHKPGQMKLFQELIGVQLWLSGCARDLFTRLNHTGISLGIGAITRCIDELTKGFDKDIHTLKDELTSLPVRQQLFRDDGSMNDIDDSDDELCLLTPDGDEQTVNDSELDETIPYETSVEDGKFGYSLVFDNVNQKTNARFSTREKGNVMLNMVQAYAAVDRIPCLQFDETLPSSQDILNIPVKAFLPNNHDTEILRHEYTVITQRILCNALSFFNDLKEKVIHHITHDYSHESKMKSKLIPLGVLNKDESKIADMVDIMEAYHAYVPGNQDTTPPIPIILYGDGLSCERANDAQNARLNSSDPWGRLEGLHPAIQEWHKRGILLEDTFKLLYDVRSSRAPGTLYHIRNRYRHHNVKGKVLHCFNHATDLLRFTTESYIIAAALKFLNTTSPSQSPPDIPADVNNKWIVFQQVCDSVVDLAFHPSILCEENQAKEYCHCREESYEEMVQCDYSGCNEGEWFHLTCVDLTPETVPDGEWYCSSGCEKHAKDKRKHKKVTDGDHLFEYTKAVMHYGLGEMARHDAIRENDGHRMISHWRLDMPLFYVKNHPKYFLQGHRLLTDLNGGASSRMAMQLIHNRTVNIHGGDGHNIEMDLQMEFFNREYKDGIKAAGGNLTSSCIDRYSRMVGVKKTMEKSFEHAVGVSTFKRKSGSVSEKRRVDINNLAQELLKLKYFESIPGRAHSGFEGFVLETHLPKVDGMKNRIRKLITKRAKRIDMATN